MRTLKVLFLDEPTNRYAAEKRLVIAVPKTIKAASCSHWQKLPHAHWKAQATSMTGAFRSGPFALRVCSQQRKQILDSTKRGANAWVE
jgi:hypothetical protein